MQSIFAKREPYKFIDRDGELAFVRSSDGKVIQLFQGETPSVSEEMYEQVYLGR